MKNVQIMETLSSIIDKVYAGMEQVDEMAVEDGDLHSQNAKDAAERHLLATAMQLDDLFGKLENEAYHSGEKSGAV